MAITTLSMVLTVFVLNLYHMGDRPVPSWITKLVLVYVARAVGVGAEDDGDRNAMAIDGGQKCRPAQTRRAVLIQRLDSDRRPVILTVRRKGTDNDNATATTVEPVAIGSPHKSDDLHPSVGEISQRYMDFAREWQRIAEVFDRLFFWFFLLATIVTTLVLFHPLTNLFVKRIT